MKEPIQRQLPTYGLAELIQKRVNLDGIEPELLSTVIADLGVTELLDQDDLVYHFGETLRRHAKDGHKRNARTALQLHLLSSLAYLRHRGMHPSPKDFFNSIAQDADMEPAEAKRFVEAIQLWVVKYGYPFSLIEEIGPDLLGEIAQSGTVRSKADAQAWLGYVRSVDRAAIRKEIKRNKERLAAQRKAAKAKRAIQLIDDSEESARNLCPRPGEVRKFPNFPIEGNSGNTWGTLIRHSRCASCLNHRINVVDTWRQRGQAIRLAVITRILHKGFRACLKELSSLQRR